VQEEQRVPGRSLSPTPELRAAPRFAPHEAVRREDERCGVVRGAAIGDDDLVETGGEAQPVEEAPERSLFVQRWDDYRKFQGPVTV
jgi:hypothetical protein